MMSSARKKKSDVVTKMAAPLSTMKFWKPGKYGKMNYRGVR